MEFPSSLLYTGFESISLNEMDGVKLMDRSDTKFLLSEEQLFGIFSDFKTDYRILEIEGQRISRYESLYFDTADLSLYHQHRRGRLPRCKVRIRHYAETGQRFLEVKVKSNKGRTIKDRVRQDEENLISEAGAVLIKKLSGLDAGELISCLRVDYSRITLVNRSMPERITLDLNLTFSDNDGRQEIPRLVIAEVKQERSRKSPFVQILHENQIREGTVSKYCWGLISLRSDLPHHHFKTKIRALHKICHGTAANTA
jgi:hypothetical protein